MCAPDTAAASSRPSATRPWPCSLRPTRPPRPPQKCRRKSPSSRRWAAPGWRSASASTSVLRLKPPPARIVLRHGTKELVLDENATAITLGRDAGSDIVIDDKKASRLHARMERRRDKFIIIDQSSNGTFVTVDGEPEIMLRRE